MLDRSTFFQADDHSADEPWRRLIGVEFALAVALVAIVCVASSLIAALPPPTDDYAVPSDQSR